MRESDQRLGNRIDTLVVAIGELVRSMSKPQ